MGNAMVILETATHMYEGLLAILLCNMHTRKTLLLRAGENEKAPLETVEGGTIVNAVSVRLRTSKCTKSPNKKFDKTRFSSSN